jgi:hypothetical protein
VRRLSLLALLAVLVSNAAVATADAAAVTAEAGLGGLSRPGRWTPVRVSIDAANASLTGEIVVDWGSARARRTITLSAGSRKLVEMYIRTPDVRETIVVWLVSEGRDLAAVEVPIRLARQEDAFTLCIAAADAWPDSRECSTTQASAHLPRSWRGYDAADDVVWPSGVAPLAREQQIALTQWRAIHALEESGHSPSALVLQTSSVLGASARRALAGVVFYLLTIAAAGFAFTRIRSRSLTLYPAVGLIVVGGSATALDAGRVGPGAEVRLQQSVVAQQLPGTGSALILLRGVAEFPSFDAFELRARGVDGAIDANQSSDRSLRYDEDGAPLMSSGTVGLGTRQSFRLEAVTAFQALAASALGPMVRVSNHSSYRLDDCQFPASFSEARIGSLAPGQSVEAERRADGDEAPFTCVLSAPIVDFTAAHSDVRSEGRTIVMLQLPQGGSER